MKIVVPRKTPFSTDRKQTCCTTLFDFINVLQAKKLDSYCVCLDLQILIL